MKTSAGIAIINTHFCCTIPPFLQTKEHDSFRKYTNSPRSIQFVQYFIMKWNILLKKGHVKDLTLYNVIRYIS